MPASSANENPHLADRQFPPGFLWGTATAAYQIEGAVNEDGRGPSIWDTFAHTPGKIGDGSTGDIAVDHYHRFKEDVQSMKAIAAQSYRFSIAWSRIFPQGTGAPNPKGLDFYDRLLDELLANDIQPFATLYHWDLPQALQDRGGWESRDTAHAFADYAGYVAERLSDRLQNFITINEFMIFVEWGYGRGLFAPGLQLPPARLYQTRHHAVLGHGLAVQAIRERGRPGTRVGLAENLAIAIPVIETPQHIQAAETATRELNASFLTAILEGRYTEAYLAQMGTDAPAWTEEELQIISQPLDFIGINIYTPTHYVQAIESAPGYAFLPFNDSHPRTNAPWHRLCPEALYWGPYFLKSIWNVPEIFITESGCSASDAPDQQGHVYDTDRVTYMRNSLTQLQRAIAEGIPVRGYFHWSLLDNFEWIFGYALRFGLIYVDYQTQKRTPKLSASYFREVATQNQVM